MERTVEIPERTAVQLSKRLPRTEFDSIDEYVAFALDQLLEEIDRQDLDSEELADVDQTDDEPLDGDIENRLESLGYL
jgi:Arc/MetJ-type ribon-helix-helix transcriptional regulator